MGDREVEKLEKKLDEMEKKYKQKIEELQDELDKAKKSSATKEIGICCFRVSY